MSKSKLSRFFEPLAVAVAGGHSIRSAADVAGCATQTAYNLSASPDFRQRVAEIRSQTTDQAVGALSDAATVAVARLRGIVDDPSQKAGDHIAASKAILSALGPMQELSELRKRLDAIENQPNLKVVR